MADIILTPADLATGCLEQPASTRVGTAVGYTGTMIPKSQWKPTDALKPYVPKGKCQFTVPACNWYAALKAFQTKYALTVGGKYPEVSYMAGYQEDTGGNFRVGTMPLDAIRTMASKGIHPIGPGCPEWFDSPRRIPQEIEAVRPTLRADEWEEVRVLDEIMSALLNTDPLDAGVDWWDSDANPGPDGHLPVRGSGRSGGHALTFYGIVMDYTPSPSRIGISFSNHHGDSLTPAVEDERGRKLRLGVWGNDGCGVMPVERLLSGAPRYGAWALRSVRVRNEDLDRVPDPVFPE